MTAKVSSAFRRERIEALADGIFATVMTILVLSLVVPTVIGMNSVATLQADLSKLLPDLFAYVITFIFLGFLWIGHQSSLSHITKFDLRILWLNILLLMGVGLIPFKRLCWAGIRCSPSRMSFTELMEWASPLSIMFSGLILEAAT